MMRCVVHVMTDSVIYFMHHIACTWRSYTRERPAYLHAQQSDNNEVFDECEFHLNLALLIKHGFTP